MRTRGGAGATPANAVMPPKLLRRQLAFLAAAVFVVALGYGGLMPVLPDWLAQFSAKTDAAEVARHVGFLSGAYAAGVLVGAPLWGVLSDRVGRSRILIAGMVGYVASLLLLWVAQQWGGLWAVYALRTATGVFVAAVVPVVTAIVAEYTPRKLRARRFAWLGAVSLLGFLFGPALYATAELAARWLDAGSAVASADLVIVLSAGLGAVVMFGLARTLPAGALPSSASHSTASGGRPPELLALLGLSGIVLFVLSGFEVGIVLQGQQHVSLTTQQVSLMFAECSLVMLGVNAMLFFTSLLEKVPPRFLIFIGTLLGLAGLVILAVHRSPEWMYLGVSLAAAGTGLVLPVTSYLAAGTAPRRLGATMGAIAAASGLGQVLGSAVGGWMFGELAQSSFAWLSLPLILTLVALLLRPQWGRLSDTRLRATRQTGGHAA
jgi:MFS family permease